MGTVATLPGEWYYLYKPAPTLTKNGPLWSASLAFVTDQSNAIAFVSAIAGQPTAISTNGGTMTRWIPLEHPLYPGLFAKNISVEMFGEASQTSQALSDLHSKSKVAVEFESYAFPIVDQGNGLTYATLTKEGGGMFTTIPGRKMAFPSDGEELGQDQGIWSSQGTYLLTQYMCSELGDDVIEPLTGTISDAVFLNKPAKQMRFDTWKAGYQTGPAGDLIYTRVLQFSYQSYSWNEFSRTDGTLEEPQDENGDPVYEVKDFSVLLNA